MRRFDYLRAIDIAEAASAGAEPGARFIAGGSNLVDLMKEDVERPTRLIDLNALPLCDIEELEGGGLRLGALATNAETAYDRRVAERYPILASAILAGASAQLRNVATNGGNLNQRTRCYYFYDTGAPCTKRGPAEPCGAIGGVTRVHAVLGASERCIATHPSDMCVALAVLDPEVRVVGPAGERAIAFADYHRLPGDEPWRDTTLEPGEVVTAIDLPPNGFAGHHSYLKLRDRQSYAFALVSAAIVLELEGDRIREGRVALGGVAHKPWRLPQADSLLTDAPADERTFGRVADALLDGAVGRGDNDFKIDLARRAILRACAQAAAGTPQPVADKVIA